MGQRTRRAALVTDGDQRAALAVTRSLGAGPGKAGGAPAFDVFVVAPRRRSLAGASRFAHRRIVAPSALDDPAGFADVVADVVQTESIDLVLPIADASVLAILDARGRFPTAKIPFASADQFRRISDKAGLLDIARSIGIAVPEQRILSAPGALSVDALATLPFPLVIKPARSVAEGDGARHKLGVSHAANMEELRGRIATYPAAGYPLLLQQRIVGPGIGVFLLVWDGQLIASFGHRRIRETPPSGGVSSYREAVEPSAELLAQSQRLLREFDWKGVAMVEFKIDEATGIPYLMEVNGRFWGSLQLAIDAGVDFPMLLAQLALDGSTNGIAVGRSGVRSRWEWGDASHLLARFRRSPAELGLPPGSPGRLRTLGAILRWRRGDKLEVFRTSDPAPFFRESIDWFLRR